MSRNAVRIAYTLPVPLTRLAEAGEDVGLPLRPGAVDAALATAETMERASPVPLVRGAVTLQKWPAERETRRRGARPKRTVESFSWHTFGGAVSTLEVHGRGLPILYRAINRRGVTSSRFIEGIREALLLLRDECAASEKRAAVWAEVEAALGPIFAGEGLPR